MIPFELSLDEFNEVEGALLYQILRLETYIKDEKPIGEIRESVIDRIGRVQDLYNRLKDVQLQHYKKTNIPLP